MRKKNHNIVVKIIFGIIAVLILLTVGYSHVVATQHKTIKLRREQQERMRREQEIQNMQSMASIKSVQPEKLQIRNNSQSDTENPQSLKDALFVTRSTSKTSVNVRETPGKDSKIVKKLPNGVNVKFISKEGNWYLVSYEGGAAGYIHKSQLTK